MIRTTINIFLVSAFSQLALTSCTNPDVENKYSSFRADNKNYGTYNSESVTDKPTVIWKVKTEGQVISSPTLSGGVIYIGSGDNNLYAIDEEFGEVKWKFRTDGAINSTPLPLIVFIIIHKGSPF